MNSRHLIFGIFTIICLAIVIHIILCNTTHYKNAKHIEHKVFRITDLNYNDKSSDIPKHFSNFPIAESYNDCTILLFNSLNYAEIILKQIQLPKNIYAMFSFKGIDKLANKSTIGSIFKEKYPLFIPETFILYNQRDLLKLRRDMKSSDSYFIFKKNIQQQEGLLISNSESDINKVGKEYVVCQKMLQNPLLIANKKINIRIYLLIISHKGKTRFFMFHDGFIYYAPSDWKPNTNSYEINITSGLKDRKIYETNPLTYRDLSTRIGEDNFKKLDRNIYTIMCILKKEYESTISKLNKHFPCICFQIMGCDIAPDSEFNAKLMEVNKGPDLRFKDARDGALKQSLVSDALDIVLHNKVNNNRFKEVLI